MKTTLLLFAAAIAFPLFCWWLAWLLHEVFRDDDDPDEDGFTRDLPPEDPYGEDGE